MLHWAQAITTPTRICFGRVLEREKDMYKDCTFPITLMHPLSTAVAQHQPRFHHLLELLALAAQSSIAIVYKVVLAAAQLSLLGRRHRLGCSCLGCISLDTSTLQSSGILFSICIAFRKVKWQAQPHGNSSIHAS